MEYRRLGDTGLEVSALCLGAMMFGSWGNPDHEDAARIVDRALDAGINFFDTADVYSDGESERILGKALRGRREDVVLATKFNERMGEGPNRGGNSRRWIFQEVEASLRRLGTDWIDLYQVHRWDPETDLDETLGALSDLIAAGKVRYVGTSTFPAAKLVEAQWVAERRGHRRFVSEQPPYSLLVRHAELDILPTCREFGIGVVAWSPLGSGWLSGAYRQGAPRPRSVRTQTLTGDKRVRMEKRFDPSEPANVRKLEAVEALALLAETAGLTLIQLALAFVLRHPAIAATIIGPRTSEHLESQLDAEEVVLGADVLDRIDEIVPPGTLINPVDTGWSNPALDAAARRR
jgi:aryl-alcohol dehydrogenase-like predicted oxidoreductase